MATHKQSFVLFPTAKVKAHELRSMSKSDLMIKVRSSWGGEGAASSFAVYTSTQSAMLRGLVVCDAALLRCAACRVVGVVLWFVDSLTYLRGFACAICIPQLKDLKTELGALRVAKVTGGAPNKLSKMYVWLLVVGM